MDRPLHVLTIIDGLGLGGAELLLSVFAEAAPTAGLRLSVAYLRDIDGSPAAARLRDHGITPQLVQGTLLHDPRGLLRVIRHVGRLRPDVIHTHLGHSDMLGAVAARLFGIPSFSTIHIMDWEAWEERKRDRAKLQLMALARRSGERVVAVSDAARAAYLDKGYDEPDHVVTLRNGTVTAGGTRQGSSVRAELGLKAEDIVITMVSVLRPGKGHDIAGPAVSALQTEFPNLRLLVLGDGPHRIEIERSLEPLGHTAVVAGQRDDVFDVLAATDILVHPTQRDALPTALIEAMAASVPSVATAVGGVPELIEDGVNGVLVPPPPSIASLADALRPMIADRALRQRMGTAGRMRYEREFTAERWVARLRDMYVDSLKRRDDPKLTTD